MSRVILVSNRVTAPRKGLQQAGGMAVVLNDIPRKNACVWLGWNGETGSEDADEARPDSVKVRGGCEYVTFPLTPAEHRDYYLGYSNSVLWPVFHNRLDLAQFEAGYYGRYLEVSRRFAKNVAAILKPSDIIWVHDYHLIPLAGALRELGIGNPIGFFLHIPVPPSQTFLAIPEHRELARALSCYDLIGLQTRADVANLLKALADGASGRILQDGRISVFDRHLAVGSFPAGIDPGAFTSRSLARLEKPLVQGPPGIRRVIGVDRLDYSKGLPEKLRAFGRLLELYPEYRRRVVLTQIAPPTRESVEAYSDIRTELERLSGKVNGAFGELDWVPIHYIHRATAREKLAAIFRASAIGLVTPLRDGMNLVVKEYIAAQDPADPGVAVLSQFAGAAEELTEALIVNPYNVDEVAGAIRAGLEMPLDERIARYRALSETITRANSEAWASAFLLSLKEHANKRQAIGDTPGWSMPELLSKVRKLQSRARGGPGSGTFSAANAER